MLVPSLGWGLLLCSKDLNRHALRAQLGRAATGGEEICWEFVGFWGCYVVYKIASLYDLCV